MATDHRRRGLAVRPMILLWILAASVARAQSPSNGSSNSDPYLSSPNFNPSMAIVIVILISAFFFLGFFSIYIRQCGGGRMDSLAASAAAAVGGRSRRQRGLDAAILETFPLLVYSEVKEHKIGKGALECAICLNEFEDDDTIRLLPKCDHVFHQDCIDAWLSTHVTCPVCRTNYAVVDTQGNEGAAVAPDTAVPPAAASTQDPPAADHVAISIGDVEREEEIRDLARIASKARGNGSRRPRRLPRSHSTGHSIMRQGDCLDRYTLRLPEHVRKEIISAGVLQRSRSVAGNTGGEGSSRRGLRGIGEGSNHRGRSIRLGRSGRWPSFVRSLSTKIPAWGNWRRGEDGSVKDPSERGKIAAGRVEA
ncbi:E3 ubiquitin-protein ligase ATL6 [Platanthera zijinensis]|uniref:RING-type E3 ubiquitin transferase n=1 Tax=Platanthera zijinensis TaxID=2320716 RepID=A0AAP0BWL8_9ASPA